MPTTTSRFATPTRLAAPIVATLLSNACAPAVEETAALAAGAVDAVDVYLPSDLRMISSRVLPGTTLASLLRGHQVTEAEVAALVARASTVFDLCRVARIRALIIAPRPARR